MKRTFVKRIFMELFMEGNFIIFNNFQETLPAKLVVWKSICYFFSIKFHHRLNVQNRKKWNNAKAVLSER